MKVAKRFLSALLSLCLMLGMIPGTALAVSSNFPFTDVSTTDWFYDAVKYVYDKGIMTGTSSTQFSPGSTTTRGMIVTVLHRMEGTPVASDAAFTDVPAGQWYSDAVAWASANDIVSGYGDGLFGPNDAITREQMATILYRYSQHKGYDASTSNSVSAFSDAAQISSYATDAMGWAVGSELISGVDNNTLDPKGNATRAQIATILMRYCESIIPSDSPATDMSTSEVKTYTVTFDLNYGNNSAYNTQTVAEGNSVNKPADPSRSGYDFNGWYAAKSGGSRFDFSSKITSDLTLYAHWSEVESEVGDTSDSSMPSTNYQTKAVTFYANGNNVENMPQTQQVMKGDTAKEPNPPVRKGYEFIGWFENNSAAIYDFSTKVTSNLSLYAQWKKKCDGDTIYVPSKNALAYDESTYVKYYNNLLLAYTNSDLDTDDANELAASVGGIIVGDISGAINMLQILVTPTNLKELEDLASQLVSSGKVYYASYDIPLEANENGTYQDKNPWSYDPKNPISDRGNEATPDGNDGWAEAIGAYTAWSYSDIYSQPVTIGVIDSGFELNHAELKDKISFLDSFPENSVNDHGINVTGILAAANNSEGIRGVADKANLVCADWTPTTDREFATSEFIAVIKQMIELKSIRVINMSLGRTPVSKDAFEANRSKYRDYNCYLRGMQRDADKTAEQCIAMMIGLLENDYKDFLFVQSAGNGYDNKGIQGYDVELNGFFCSVNNRIFNNAKIRGKYQYTDIKKHIMVAGGSSLNRDEDGNYNVKEGYNLGPEIDICAPSVIIFTTGLNNNYESGQMGTSLSAPMVAGSAALLWSINPTLKTEAVYDFLTDNTPFCAIDGNDKYPMLNVGQAVKSVIETLPTYSGEIVDANTGAPVLAKITVIKGGTDQVIATCTSNASGVYMLPKLPGGLHSLKVEADGYESTSKLIKLTYSEYSLGTIRMVPFNSPVFTPYISGIVNDASTGTALDSVDVYVYDKDGTGPLFTSKTDSSGAFSIALDANGTYSLKFTKDGYADKDITSISVLGAHNVGSVQLTPTTVVPGDQYVITGTVKDARTGATLAGMRFAVYKGDELSLTTSGETDATGAFSISLSESGTYSVAFLYNSGYIDKEVIVEDVSGETPIGVVTLDPAAKGSGTQNDPYQIETPQQLNAVRKDFLDSYYYILIDDIDLSVYPNWEPISKFKGSLDGNGHVIKNLTITSADTTYAGLFGQVDAGILKNITLENVNIDLCYDSVEYTVCCGALAGSYSTSYTSELSGSITNCHASGKIAVSVSQGDYSRIGGLIGSLHSAGQFAVSDCHNYCDMTSSNINSGGTYYGSSEVGGIIGCVRGEYDYRCSVIFENCSNGGELSGTMVGGIVGSGQDFLFDNTQLIFNQCYNSGKITGDRYAGGIVGRFYYSSTGGHMFYLTVKNSYNCGAVSGGYSSGIAGYSGGTTDIGGAYATIQNCYSIGDISAENYPTGILGPVNRGTRKITNCYYANADQGDQGATESSVKLTLAEFQSQDNLSGFDFGSVWTYSGEYLYPQLQGNLQ